MQQKNERIAFDGKKYRIYQWDQAMYNGDWDVFERVEHKPSATVFALYQGKIVIQDQMQPHYKQHVLCVPGGGLEWDEDPLEGAKRELLEEEGLESGDWELWTMGGYERENSKWQNFIFIARECQKTCEPQLDAGEKIEHLLYSPQEFFDLLEDPHFRHRDIIERLRTIRDDRDLRRQFLNQLGVQE
jgi:ADP-ribose pyrophosphatase YjhB (NUDIX family)